MFRLFTKKQNTPRPGEAGYKPRAVAFVDYEHWYISLDKMYGNTRPDIKGWFGELSQKFDLGEVVFFADFSNQSLRADIPRIREVTNHIIETQNASDRFEKDFTDFIMLDHIYQRAMTSEDIDVFIIFSGDGHFSSVVSFITMRLGKKVGVYAVRGALSRQLRNSASWSEEYPSAETVAESRRREREQRVLEQRERSKRLREQQAKERELKIQEQKALKEQREREQRALQEQREREKVLQEQREREKTVGRQGQKNAAAAVTTAAVVAAAKQAQSTSEKSKRSDTTQRAEPKKRQAKVTTGEEDVVTQQRQTDEKQRYVKGSQKSTPAAEKPRAVKDLQKTDDGAEVIAAEKKPGSVKRNIRQARVNPNLTEEKAPIDGRRGRSRISADKDDSDNQPAGISDFGNVNETNVSGGYTADSRYDDASAQEMMLRAANGKQHNTKAAASSQDDRTEKKSETDSDGAKQGKGRENRRNIDSHDESVKKPDSLEIKKTQGKPKELSADSSKAPNDGGSAKVKKRADIPAIRLAPEAMASFESAPTSGAAVIPQEIILEEETTSAKLSGSSEQADNMDLSSDKAADKTERKASIAESKKMILKNLEYLEGQNRLRLQDDPSRQQSLPTFWGTVEVVTRINGADKKAVLAAMRELLDKNYLYQDTVRLDGKDIKVLRVDWYKAKADEIL